MRCGKYIGKQGCSSNSNWELNSYKDIVKDYKDMYQDNRKIE